MSVSMTLPALFTRLSLQDSKQITLISADGHRLHVQQAILAYHSTLFNSAAGRLLETQMEVILLPGQDKTALTAVHQFLHTCRYPKLPHKSFSAWNWSEGYIYHASIYAAAKKLDIKSLQRLAFGELVDMFKTSYCSTADENNLPVRGLADLVRYVYTDVDQNFGEEDKMRRKTVGFIAEHWGSLRMVDLCQGGKFQKVLVEDSDFARELLTHPNLDVNQPTAACFECHGVAEVHI